MKFISPCISICKSDPKTGFCYGCARTDEEKKDLEKSRDNRFLKEENLIVLKAKNRMSETQIKTFNQSYSEKRVWENGLL